MTLVGSEGWTDLLLGMSAIYFTIFCIILYHISPKDGNETLASTLTTYLCF